MNCVLRMLRKREGTLCSGLFSTSWTLTFIKIIFDHVIKIMNLDNRYEGFLCDLISLFE